MATPKQRKAREHFKSKIDKAKKIRKQHPHKKWATCVKEAFK